MDSQFKHETFIIRTEVIEQCEDLSPEQVGKCFMSVLEYARSGEVVKSDDALSNMVFKGIKASLDSNWRKYDKSITERQFNARIGGIISRLKCGIIPKRESIEFLRENGYLSEEYLKKSGVSDGMIKKIISSNT